MTTALLLLSCAPVCARQRRATPQRSSPATRKQSAPPTGPGLGVTLSEQARDWTVEKVTVDEPR